MRHAERTTRTRSSAAGALLLMTVAMWIGRADDAEAQIAQVPTDAPVTTADLELACNVVLRHQALIDAFDGSDETLTDDQRRALTRGQGLDAGRLDRLDPFCRTTFRDLRGVIAAGIPTRADIRILSGNATLRALFNTDVARTLSGSGAAGLMQINESAILEGFVDFLVDRASQEIQVAFLNRLETWMCDDDARKRVFRNGCAALSEDQFTLRTDVLTNLRNALERDLRRMPATVPAALAADDTRFASITNPGTQDLILSTYFLGQLFVGLLDGLPAHQALVATIDPASVDRPDPDNRLLQRRLQAQNGTLVYPAAALLYRVGLAATILPDVDGDGLVDWPTNPAQRESYFRALVVNLPYWLAELHPTLTDVQVRAAAERPLRAARAVLRALADTEAALAATDDDTKTDDAAVDQLLGLVETWSVVLAPLWAPDAADPSAESVAPSLGTVVPYLVQVAAIGRELAAERYQQAIASILTLVANLSSEQIEIPTQLVRATSFAAALAEADSASQVSEIFESFAEPVGSYQGKRRSESTYVTLNAYLGGTAASETAGGQTGRAVGVGAPVGIEVGWALGKGWSLGLLAQLIDVGTLASYRIEDADPADPADVESDPVIGFAQVFSPGLLAVVGLPDLPLVLGVGWSRVPRLRQRVDSALPDEDAVRWSLMVGIDVPVLRFR